MDSVLLSIWWKALHLVRAESAAENNSFGSAFGHVGMVAESYCFCICRKSSGMHYFQLGRRRITSLSTKLKVMQSVTLSAHAKTIRFSYAFGHVRMVAEFTVFSCTFGPTKCNAFYQIESRAESIDFSYIFPQVETVAESVNFS